MLFGMDVKCGEYSKMIAYPWDHVNPRNEVWVCAKNQVQHSLRRAICYNMGTNSFGVTSIRSEVMVWPYTKLNV